MTRKTSDDVTEKIKKFIKYDNEIKKQSSETQKTLKSLKHEKIELEKYMLDYLTETQRDTINFTENGGDIQLKKVTKIKISPINADIINQSMTELLISENLSRDNQHVEKLVELLLENIEKNRLITKVDKIERNKKKKI